MKKIIALVLALGLTIGLAACGGNGTREPDDTTTAIATTVEPDGGETDIVLYLPNEAGTGLVTVTTQIGVAIPDEMERVVELLIEHSALPIGVAALGMDDGTLDMNEAFAQALNELGSTGELLMLASLVNTFLQHFGWESILITVEGQTLETGHNVYDEPLTYFLFDEMEEPAAAVEATTAD